MNQSLLLLFPIFLPILAGICLLVVPEVKGRKKLIIFINVILILTGIMVLNAIINSKEGIILFWLTKNIPIYFKIDDLGKIFASIVIIVWTLAGFFSIAYMRKVACEKRYFAFYLITFGVLLGLDFSGNLITMYLFYEIMTLVLIPLIIHNRSREAIMAGLKYLFYSLCGAYMALFGLFFLSKYATDWTFRPNGVLDMNLVQGHVTLLLLITFLMIVGFGVKAGMFPLHAWLPTAHPVAPAPASAVLSGIIVKSGTLAIIRVIYYIIGPDFLRGTWVQYAWMVLILITIFMGSLLAYQEPVMKKRFAYSTVSQISYILYGLAMMNPIGMTGALLHIIFHAFIKTTLFLIAGIIIYQTGKQRADQLTGIGYEMPVTIWCFTLVSMALIGIPPMSGFVSKWYLATGSLQTNISVFSWLGPVVLLISALLTAGYLLPITIKGFFPGNDFDYRKCKKMEPSNWMLIPVIVLTVLTVLLGIAPNGLISYLNQIVETIL